MRKLRFAFIMAALVAALLLGLPLLTALAAGPTYVQAIGDDGWKSDDTRGPTGADLVGVNYTHYGKPGQTPTAADDTAIAQQIQFVANAPGNTAAVKLSKTSPSGGYSKTTISKVNESGYASGDAWLTGFFANYRSYTNSEVPVLKVGIRSTLWGTGAGESQAPPFAATRSGESAWDLILVVWDQTPTLNTWRLTQLDADTVIWFVYKQGGNGFFNAAPNGTYGKSLNQWKACTDVAKTIGGTDYSWGQVLFGAASKVVGLQHGVGSSTTNTTSYVDWLETSLLNGGDRVEFGPPQEPVWVPTSDPVLTGSNVQDACVIKDGATYKAWYWLRDDQTIWYADSTDGVAWANKQQVLAKSGDETKFIEGPAVIKDGATYKMWYSARDSAGLETIRYATSTNGTTWVKELDGANPKKVVNVGAAGAWDSFRLRNPWVIKDGGTYKMWYAGCTYWPQFKIGYAESADGIVWAKNSGNPIFSGTPGGWDAFEVYGPSVVKAGSAYHMYFSGSDSGMSQRWSTGYATSTDGLAWTEAARSPILTPNYGDSLDFPSILLDSDGVWKMWYSQPYPTSGEYGIFMATMTTGTELYLSPAVGSIPNDHATTKTYTVRLANAVDLYGYQFQVQFDPAKLEATAAAFDNSFFSSSVASPGGWNATIDNGAGKVSFARTRMNSSPPELPVTGSGPLATVTFKSKDGAAINRLDFVAGTHILGNIEGDSLAHTTQHAWLTTYDYGVLQGTVDLQGRSNESGAVVTICNAAGYIASTTTNAAGAWQFTGVPVGDYQVNAEMARYLDAQKGDFSGAVGGVSVSSGGTTTLNLVKLLGGDTNDDEVIDISDLTAIGGVFGETPPASGHENRDINNDNAINILDLVLAAGNYSKHSIVDVPWS